jgi:hypothetical protein
VAFHPLLLPWKPSGDAVASARNHAVPRQSLTDNEPATRAQDDPSLTIDADPSARAEVQQPPRAARDALGLLDIGPGARPVEPDVAKVVLSGAPRRRARRDDLIGLLIK